MIQTVKKMLVVGYLLCLLPQLGAQSVQVMVSPDRATWQYSAKEPVTFEVKVYKNNVLLKNATVDYELGAEYFPTERKQGVKLEKGELSLKTSMGMPGFLRCKVTTQVDGHQYEGIATVGYDVTQIKPLTQEPADFDQFWNGAIAQARMTPLKPQMRLLAERCTSTQNVYEVSFHNYGASKVYGILVVPKKAGKYPAILHVPGAGVRGYEGSYLADNIITLQIGIHGIPLTLPQELYTSLGGGAFNGYQYYSMNDRDKHYFKRVFTGCVRAIDFIYELPEFDGTNVGVTGGSQGGALAMVTAGLDERITFLSAYFPALCDYAGYLHGRAGGWPHYFRDKKPLPNEVETLAYYDVVNFARRIKAKGWYTWGYNDVVCPPTSMYAAYNVVTAPKELALYYMAGHSYYVDQRTVGNEWLREQCK